MSGRLCSNFRVVLTLLSNQISSFPFSDTLASCVTSFYHTSADFIAHFLHSSQYTLKPMRSCLLRYSLCANPLHPIARCPTDSIHVFSINPTLRINILPLNCCTEEPCPQRLFLGSKNISFCTLFPK